MAWSRHRSATSQPAAGRSAAQMINDCFRHQHPEAYGGSEVPEPEVPTSLREGRDPPLPSSTAEIPEPVMGHPAARDTVA
jgi:hypothetical protein